MDTRRRRVAGLEEERVRAQAVESIEAVVVAVPARDEVATIGRCVASLLSSIDRLLRDVDSCTAVIAVACDSCSDGTGAEVRRVVELGGSPRCQIEVIEGSWGTAGGTRRAAVRAGLNRLVGGPDPHRTWIATTDADSDVPFDWLVRQLRYANTGFDAVAGVVELIDPSHEAATAFRRIYSLTPGHEHHHVHGANFGVRADAYVDAGEFPSVVVSEDHELWGALRRSGRRCVSPLDVVVHTSPRPTGRAAGGFADTLAGAVRDLTAG